MIDKDVAETFFPSELMFMYY